MITGLDELGLHVSSLPRLGSRKALAVVHTEHFRVTRDFLLRRERMLRQLFAEDDPAAE
jgi:hypothetical protein